MIHVKQNTQFRKNLKKVSCEEPHKFLQFSKYFIFIYYSYSEIQETSFTSRKGKEEQSNNRKIDIQITPSRALLLGNNRKIHHTGRMVLTSRVTYKLHPHFRALLLGKNRSSLKRQPEKSVSSVVHQLACCRRENRQPQKKLTSVQRQPEKLISSVGQQLAYCRRENG